MSALVPQNAPPREPVGDAAEQLRLLRDALVEAVGEHRGVESSLGLISQQLEEIASGAVAGPTGWGALSESLDRLEDLLDALLFAPG